MRFALALLALAGPASAACPDDKAALYAEVERFGGTREAVDAACVSPRADAGLIVKARRDAFIERCFDERKDARELGVPAAMILEFCGAGVPGETKLKARTAILSAQRAQASSAKGAKDPAVSYPGESPTPAGLKVVPTWEHGKRVNLDPRLGALDFYDDKVYAVLVLMLDEADVQDAEKLLRIVSEKKPGIRFDAALERGLLGRTLKDQDIVLSYGDAVLPDGSGVSFAHMSRYVDIGPDVKLTGRKEERGRTLTYSDGSTMRLFSGPQLAAILAHELIHVGDGVDNAHAGLATEIMAFEVQNRLLAGYEKRHGVLPIIPSLEEDLRFMQRDPALFRSRIALRYGLWDSRPAKELFDYASGVVRSIGCSDPAKRKEWEKARDTYECQLPAEAEARAADELWRKKEKFLFLANWGRLVKKRTSEISAMPEEERGKALDDLEALDKAVRAKPELFYAAYRL
jgi:hypothetical protein